jgi:hypothetical protein
VSITRTRSPVSRQLAARSRTCPRAWPRRRGEDALVCGQLVVGSLEVLGGRLRRGRQLLGRAQSARRTRPGRCRRSRGSCRRRSGRRAGRRAKSGKRCGASGKSAVESRTIAVLSALRSTSGCPAALRIAG